MSRRPERRGRGASEAVVLVVDDEADIRELLELSLLRMGLKVELAGGVGQAKSLLAERSFDLCLTDMRLPDGDGLDLVRHIATESADVPVAVITAHGSTESAVAALKSGAFDYLTKPLALEQLRTLVKSALLLPGKGGGGVPASVSHELLGNSPSMTNARDLIVKLARSQAPVYISGESGSGKEVAARAIHRQGSRSEKPFVAVNCGAIPDNLLESEFFGYRKGAFTGADTDRTGVFHAADGGTLFLDEIADLPPSMQVKLLRVIQEKRVRRVGDSAEEPVDARIICATHRDLAACVESGKFRQDLYFRLAVIELRMPPLRECAEDIPVIVESILERIERETGGRAWLSRDALAVLTGYSFPGNVRELENVLERAVALAGGGEITTDALQLSPPAFASDLGGGGSRWPLQDYLDRIEREAIVEALEKTRFNRTAAAKLLGITFRSLRYRMQRLGID